MDRQNLNTQVSLITLSAAFVLTSACQPFKSGSNNAIPDRQEQTTKQKQRAKLDRLNAENKFDVSQMTQQLQLAVEVSVMAEGISVVGVSIIRAPIKSNSALADLRVSVLAGSNVVADYTIADPRIVEEGPREGEEAGEQKTLPEARTFVFALLSENLTEIQINPVDSRKQFVSKGGTIDARPLIQQACQERSDVEECRKLLRR